MLATGATSAEPLENWPRLFNVSGVAANDRLNVRRRPDASSSIIGALQHDATSIEVIRSSEDGRWARVNLNEEAGWVNLQFLTENGPAVAAERPEPVLCYGTEPFWAFSDRTPEQFKFQFPEADPLFFRPAAMGPSQNHSGRYFVTGANDEMTFGGILRAEICSDGMSDREFGISIDLVFSGQAGSTFVSGCCSVAP